MNGVLFDDLLLEFGCEHCFVPPFCIIYANAKPPAEDRTTERRLARVFRAPSRIITQHFCFVNTFFIKNAVFLILPCQNATHRFLARENAWLLLQAPLLAQAALFIYIFVIEIFFNCGIILARIARSRFRFLENCSNDKERVEIHNSRR
ncbi:MAG: hypothetical protein J6U75_02660, partial [Clostridia bacterium]|nr:hypothetical protein [Clostridia bacterium]